MGLEDIYRRIGANLRARRRRLGLTLEELAESASRHPTYIGQIERGGRKASLETLSLLAASLDLPLSQLFDGELASPASGVPRLEALLRTRSAAERRLILSTARHLARQLRSLGPRLRG